MPAIPSGVRATTAGWGLAGFGAGMTAASAVLRWGPPPARRAAGVA